MNYKRKKGLSKCRLFRDLKELLYDGEMIEGDMSQRLQQLVREFINYYRERLIQMWEKQDFEELPPIE